MKNKKTLLIISIIAIAVVAAGIVIYNTKQKKDEQLKVFATQVKSFKDLNTTYNIKNSKEYTDLLNESQKALESNDLNQINLIEKTISKFKDQLIKENSQELETLISEIKKIDISKLKNKINFENQLNDINNLKADQNFKEAIQRTIQLKATIIKEKADFDVVEKKRLAKEAEEKRLAKERKNAEKNLALNGYQQLFTYFKGDKSKINNQISMTKKLAELHNINIEDVTIDHFLDSQLDYFPLEDTFVDWGYYTKYPIFFIENSPIYKYTVWSNTRLIVYTYKNGDICYNSKLIEAFESNNLYNFENGKKVKTEYMPHFPAYTL